MQQLATLDLRRTTPGPDVLDHLPHAVAVLDPTGLVLETNPSWERERVRSSGTNLVVAAAPGVDFVERCRSTTGALAPAGGHVADGLARVLAGRADRFEVEYVLDGAPGEDDDGRCYLLTATTLPGPAGAAGGAIVTHQDLTTLHRVHRVFTEMAFTDPLTGLPNRALVLDRLRVVLERTHRTSGGVAVLFVDLDRFKAVNDDHGHAAGDRVLQEIGRRLRRSIRSGDTCGRWGGDEFVLVVQLDEDDELPSVVERTKAVTREPVRLSDTEVIVGMSLGVVLAEPGDRADALLDLADCAMYEAKRADRPDRARVEITTV